jgi:hypothetical protein
MTHLPLPPGSKTPLFSSAVYDKLKWVALVFLPAFGVLYFGLAEIWGLPYAVQVMGTSAALDTFLGVLLGISNSRYNNSDAKYDGSVMIDMRDPKKDVMSFTFDKPVDKLGEVDSVTMKVETPPAEDSQ